jgi:hypothetical protein
MIKNNITTFFKLVFSILISLFFPFELQSQRYFIPLKTSNIDLATYERYSALLKISFYNDSIMPDSDSKHNIYVSYDWLNADEDTVFKYINYAIDFDAIDECEDCCNKNSFIFKKFSKKYPQKWIEICKRCDSAYAKFNKSLIDTLKKIKEDDQYYRKDTNLQSQNSKNLQIWEKQRLIDSLNLEKVESIFKKFGYPGKKLVGTELSDVAFLVIQHASLEKQEKYFELMKLAVKERQLGKRNLALLIDRMNMKKNIPQIYGTQLIWDKKKEKLVLYPVADIIKVDERRNLMNLYPLKDYLKYHNIELPRELKNKN